MLSILTRPDCPIRTELRFTQGMARSMDLIWPDLGERIHLFEAPDRFVAFMAAIRTDLPG
jgi:hypothetical protein